MATAREENTHTTTTTTTKNDNPYGGGLGAGGKFRRKPYRRPPSTPYDRPPTGLRNSSLIGSSDSNANGWLRKIVDPAQRLITSSAHKLFASVFRKRLTQTPHQPPEADSEVVDKQQGAVPAVKSSTIIVSREQKAATTADENVISSSGSDPLSELEEILKQKTFTRAEINHLMALLQARTIDEPAGHEEKAHEVLPSKSVLTPARQEELQIVPLQDKLTDGQKMTNNVVNSRVLDEDIASPAELAKAYMGHRPSKVGPAALGLRSQAPREDSSPLSILPGPSKSPMLSLVPKSIAYKGGHDNVYTTPRSHGRSAIYSMARTPYSRIRQRATFNSSGLSTGNYGGSSLAPRALDQSGHPGSKGLKGSSAVFEDGFGSFGPIRRTRQKPNLSSQRSCSLAASEEQEPPSSTQKLLSMGAPKQKYTGGLMKDEMADIPGRNMISVSSKSTEMASRIFQQLDTIVSPQKDKLPELKIATAKDKEPARLSPSKLRGPALRSLEHIDSSKFLDIAHNSSLDFLSGKLLHDTGESSSKKQEKFEAGGPSKLFAASDTPLAVNGFLSKKETVSNGSMVAVTHPQSEKKSAFRMNAAEDFLDLDDDGIANGVASTMSDNETEKTEKQEAPVIEAKKMAAEASMEKPPLVSDGKLLGPSFSRGRPDLESSSGMSVVAAKSDSFNSSTPTTSTAFQSVASVAPVFVSDSAPSEQQSNAAPIIGFGDRAGSEKEQQNAPVFKFSSSNGLKVSNGDKAPIFPFASSTSSGEQNLKFSSSSGSKLESSDRSRSPAGPIVPAFGAFGSDKADDKKSGAISGTVVSASLPIALTSSTTNMFTFGTSGFNPSNGSVSSTQVTADSGRVAGEKPLTSFTLPSTTRSSTSFLATTTTSSLPSSGGALSSSVSPAFKFGSSSSISLSQASPTSDVTAEAVTGADLASGITTGGPFTGSSSASTSIGSSIFGFSAGVNGNANSKRPEAVSFSAANGPSQVQASPSVNAVSGFSQSAMGPSSVSSTTTDIFSAKTVFGLSSAGNILSPGTFGASSNSAADGLGSSSTGTSTLFGSTWQSPKSTTFGSSSSSGAASAGFSFGLSSSSSCAFVFGSGGTISASSGFPTFGATGSSSASAGSSIFGVSGSSSASNSVPSFGSAGTSSASFSVPISVAAPIIGAAGTSSASTASPIFGAGSSSASSGSSIFGSLNTSFVPTSPVFGASGTSSVFGLTGGSSASTSLPTFGMTGASSGSTFSFNAVPATSSSQPVFGNANPAFAFASASSGNNESNMEDSMAEDTVQATTPPVPAFGQVVTPSPIVFGSSGPSGANPFQFLSPPPATPQNLSSFQASGSLDFNAGESFSLGTSGGDKAGRKIVKVNRNKLRRK